MRLSKTSLWFAYPLLLALYPPIALFSANLGQVGIEKIVFPLAFSVGVAAVVWSVCYLIVKDYGKTALLSSIILVSFFTYGHFYGLVEGYSLGDVILGRHRFLAVIWVIASLIILLGILRLRSVPVSLHNVFTIFGIAVLIMPVFQITTSLANSTKAVVSGESDESQGVQLFQGYKPDIYYIILDTYTRSDILRDEYGYDNSEFIDYLRNTGFYVADCAKANYNQTNLSLYLSLNMDYLANPGDFEDISLGRGIRYNAARLEFEELGYKTVAFETGYNFTEWFNADYYFLPTSSALGTESILSRLGSFDIMFLRSTFLAPVVDANIQQANYAEESYRRSVTLFTLEKLKEVPQITGPKLVFVHLSINHPPFVFDASGGANPELIKVIKPKAENDPYYKGFRGTFPFADAKINEVVNAILQNSKQPPVIILQGDHGPERVGSSKHYEILNALYLPGVDTSDLYPTLSPINTFRIVLNKYFGQNYQILPDESYSSRPGETTHMIPIMCPAE